MSMGLTKQTARFSREDQETFARIHQDDWLKVQGGKSKGKKSDKSKDQEHGTKELRTERPTGNHDAEQ